MGEPKKVMANASAHVVGVVLLQEDKNRDWRPVCVTSRQFRSAEMSCTVHQKECLAIFHALTK